MKKKAPAPIPEALAALYKAQDTLRIAFPHHPFGLDGNLIGDIGEAIAEKDFGLVPLRGGNKSHDMQRPSDNALVQVKTTQKASDGKGVGLGLVKTTFDFLLVLEVDKDGSYEVLYDGPGDIIDAAREHKKGASLSRKQLRACQKELKARDKLTKDH